jgi:hypothetical protein
MGRSWALINSSSMFRRLALCMAIVGIVSEVSTWVEVRPWVPGNWVHHVITPAPQ